MDILESAIFKFLSLIRQQSLTGDESRTHQDLMGATVTLEALADVIETELSGLVIKFIEKERQVSETTRQLSIDLHGEVLKTVELAVGSIRDNDQPAATEVRDRKERITLLAEKLLTRKSEHLGQGETVELETARIEISLVDKLLRIYSMARRIADIVLPPEVRKNA